MLNTLSGWIRDILRFFNCAFVATLRFSQWIPENIFTFAIFMPRIFKKL